MGADHGRVRCWAIRRPRLSHSRIRPSGHLCPLLCRHHLPSSVRDTGRVKFPRKHLCNNRIHFHYSHGQSGGTCSIASIQSEIAHGVAQLCVRIYTIDTAFKITLEHYDMQELPEKSISPANLIELLSLSPGEFFAQCYVLLLGRLPEPAARHDGEIALRLGRGRIPVLITIYRSHEAKAYRNRLFVQSTDAEFINEAYNLYLGRPVEKAGLDHYIKQLKRQTRKKFLAKLSRSLEARAVGTLWNDVEQLNRRLLQDRWPWRWAAHRRRLHSLEQEIALRHTAFSTRVSAASQPGLAVTGSAQSPSGPGTPSLSVAGTARQSLQSLGAIAEDSLGAHSHRILRRMRALVEHEGQGHI